MADVTEAFVSAWIARFQGEVGARAEAEGLAARDFACTTLAAVVGSESFCLFQIGDGAIVYSLHDDAETYHCAFWPQRGEYENLTYFTTDDAAQEYADFLARDRRVDEIALFTDGLQRLALRYESRAPHTPFFRPMFAPVRSAPPGFSCGLSKDLGRFLDSDRINGFTDDDKTLVLATRRNSVERRDSSGNHEVRPTGGGLG